MKSCVLDNPQKVKSFLDAVQTEIFRLQRQLPLDENKFTSNDIADINKKIHEINISVAFIKGYFDATGWQQSKRWREKRL